VSREILSTTIHLLGKNLLLHYYRDEKENKTNSIEDLQDGSSDQASAQFVKELYKKIAIPANSVARAVLYAVEQPADVEIDEVVLRPPRRISEGAMSLGWVRYENAGY